MPTRDRIVRLLCAAVWVAVQSGCASFEGARFYQRGSEALERGDADQAIADLERAAELVPHASEIQNHLGLAYEVAGRHESATSAFRRAVELDCDNEAAQANLRLAQKGLAEP